METLMERSAPVPPAAPAPAGAPSLPVPAAWSITLAGAFLAGVLTSIGQAVPGLATLSNSAGPWFVVTIGLLFLVRPRLVWALPLGVGLLLLMHVGYTVTSNLRGFPDSLSPTNPWVLLAVPSGLLAGACVVGLRGLGQQTERRRRWRSVAAGVVVAVLAGEGIRGLLQVSGSTGAASWTVEIVIAGAVLVAGLVVARSQVARVLVLGTALVGTAVVLGAYLGLGGV